MLSLCGSLAATGALLALLFVQAPVLLGEGAATGGVLIVFDLPAEQSKGAAAGSVQRPAAKTSDAASSSDVPVVARVASAARAPDSGAASRDQVQSDQLAGADSGASAESLRRSTYQDAVREHVLRFIYYPDGARPNRMKGLVRVQFDMSRDGHVLSAWIQQSSGYDILDEAALLVVRRAEPMPPIPATLPAEMEISLPLDFVPPSFTLRATARNDFPRHLRRVLHLGRSAYRGA
jgi:periplasmic protein TonB